MSQSFNISQYVWISFNFLFATLPHFIVALVRLTKDACNDKILIMQLDTKHITTNISNIKK